MIGTFPLHLSLDTRQDHLTIMHHLAQAGSAVGECLGRRRKEEV
jgi:hypothetical protein